MKPQGRFLSKISTLRVIRRRYYHDLFDAISLMKQLISLDIHYIDVEVLKRIRQLKQLTHLNIGGFNIYVEGAKYIGELEELRELNISRNEIGCGGTKYLSELHQLTNLNVTKCNIKVEGAKYISNLKQLTKLNIGNNEIGSEGVKYITELKQLTRLNINSNNIGNEGAELIVITMKQLKSLEIYNNQIDLKVGNSLSEALTNTDIEWYENDDN